MVALDGQFSRENVEGVTGRSAEAWMTLLHDEAQRTWPQEQTADYLQRVYEMQPAWAELLSAERELYLGRKPTGLTSSAGYQIGVRRTYPVAPATAWALLTSPAGVRLWWGELPAGSALSTGSAFTSSEGVDGQIRVYKEAHHLRMSWRLPEWPQSAMLQIRVIPTKMGKTTVSFHQDQLPDLYARQQVKQYWEAVASNLISLLTHA